MAKKKRAKAKKRAARPKSKKVIAKRPDAKKRDAKKARVAKKKALEAALEKVGEVTHYFPKVKAAAVLISKGSIRLGDAIYIKGHTTDFKEHVASIQLDRAPIDEGIPGQEIGLLVKSRVRIGDSVYKL